jgi:hypothetical protein
MESSPVMWEGPPTERIERSGKVKGRQGRDLGVKKGLREGKLHFWRSITKRKCSVEVRC